MFIGDCETLANGLYLSVDWISFTIKESMSYLDVVSYFGLRMEDFQTGLNGRYGYKSRIQHSIVPIHILYDGNDDMGVHVDISGSAVGYFLNAYKEKKTCEMTPFGELSYSVESFDSTVLTDLLKDIMDKGQLTRLDLAVDDLGCRYYSLDELTDIFNSGLYVSKFKKWKLNIEKCNGETTGHTIYLGSRTSEIMFRIYDKKLEQNSKSDCDTIDNPWVRWEIELHKDRACAVALYLISGNNLSNAVIGILANYLRLIERDNERNSRCSTSDKWNDFICGISKLSLYQRSPEKTLEEKKEWLIKQVAPTISAIYRIDGDLSFIYDLIDNGSSRISAELRHLIQNALEGVSYDVESCI